MNTNNDLHAQLSRELLIRHSMVVSASWLTNFISTTRAPPPPLSALASTARFRILASDITTSLSNSSSDSTVLFPPDINDVNIKERCLNNSHGTRVTDSTVIVQVLDIQDLSTSKWSQVEAIERIERGEEIRGREVIRNVPIMDEDDGIQGHADNSAVSTATVTAMSSSAKKSSGPHKLVLQDATGTKVTAFELIKVPGVEFGIADDSGGMCIGCKMALKPETVIRRGMLMLRPEHVTVLGGKVESWDKKFRQGRKERLIAEVQSSFENNRIVQQN